MLLHEIIETNDGLTDAILVEELHKYKNSLFTYYSDYFTSEPVLMVVSVMNACQYALIAPAGEYLEAMESYLGHSATAEESELIGFQSIMLKDF